MAQFLTDLLSSIFTPGPTPSLLTATNASFAALQTVLLALLIATYSVHFVVLSFLSAFLWYAINWFVQELQAATAKEEEAKKLRETRRAHESDAREEDSGDETEGVEERDGDSKMGRSGEVDLTGPSVRGDDQRSLRKRRNSGEHSHGELSTDSEWDKVGDSESDIAGKSSQEE